MCPCIRGAALKWWFDCFCRVAASQLQVFCMLFSTTYGLRHPFPSGTPQIAFFFELRLRESFHFVCLFFRRFPHTAPFILFFSDTLQVNQTEISRLRRNYIVTTSQLRHTYVESRLWLDLQHRKSEENAKMKNLPGLVITHRPWVLDLSGAGLSLLRVFWILCFTRNWYSRTSPLPFQVWNSFPPLIAAVLSTPKHAESMDSGRMGVICALVCFFPICGRLGQNSLSLAGHVAHWDTET